jgi:hypothetical protein
MMAMAYDGGVLLQGRGKREEGEEKKRLKVII